MISSSLSFGGAHLLGAKDKASKRFQSLQAVNATMLGFAFGMLNRTYGMWGSFTAHLVHNFIISMIVKFAEMSS